MYCIRTCSDSLEALRWRWLAHHLVPIYIAVGGSDLSFPSMPCITLLRFSTSALNPSRSVVQTKFTPDPPPLLASDPEAMTALGRLAATGAIGTVVAVGEGGHTAPSRVHAREYWSCRPQDMGRCRVRSVRGRNTRRSLRTGFSRRSSL